MKLSFLDRFSKNSEVLQFMKILPMGVSSMWTDGRIDEHRHDERSSLLSQFCERA